MLHEAFTSVLRSGLRSIAAVDYDYPKAVLVVTLAIANTLVLGAVPSVIQWVNYPCDGTVYDLLAGEPKSCYPDFPAIGGPLNGKMHEARKFIFDHFSREPWPRKAEIIIEPAAQCLRCPRPIMDCVFNNAFDVCWAEDGTGVQPGPESLPPLPVSALDALADAQALIEGLGVLDACWQDVPELGHCHPANVSSTEFGASVGVVAKGAWLPLELGGDALKSEMSAQFESGDGALPPALKYSFFLTGKSVDYSAFPSVWTPKVIEFENSFHVQMKALRATYPELTISWFAQSQVMTEFTMEVFPAMLLCLPLAFSMLSALVVLAFVTYDEEGRVVLPLTKASILDPVVCLLVANLAVMGSFGTMCLVFPHIYMGHIFGSSIGLAIGIDGMLVMHSYIRRPLATTDDPRTAFIERFSAGAIAVTFTTLTTAIAFLATAISVFQMAIEIGVCCCIAVGFNWLYVVTFYGAYCVHMEAPPQTSKFFTQPLFEGAVYRLVSSGVGKGLVIAAALTLLGSGLYTFDMVEREAGFEPIFDTESSTIIRWQYAAYRHFGDAYTWNCTLVLASADIEYADAAAQARIAEAAAAAGASDYIDAGSADSWLAAFLAEAGPLTGGAFYAALRGWLGGPSGRRFVDDVELVADEACTIKCIPASRIRFTQSRAQWGDAFPVYVAAIESMAPFADLDARLFADEWIIYELDEYNKYAAKVAVAVGTGGITAALFLFFHPAVALVTAASIFCIEIMTVPFLVLGNIKIGPAVVFSAGAAFGLASDSLVHMIHAWHEATAAGDPEPVKSALSLIGHPVLFAGLSTIGMSRGLLNIRSMFGSFMVLIIPQLGLILPGAGHVGIAYTLSLTFVAFVAVQIFYGLLLVPAVLHMVSPAPDGEAKPSSML